MHIKRWIFGGRVPYIYIYILPLKGPVYCRDHFAYMHKNTHTVCKYACLHSWVHIYIYIYACIALYACMNLRDLEGGEHQGKG